MPEAPSIENWDTIRDFPSKKAESEIIPDIVIRVGDHDKVNYTWHMITPENDDEDLVATNFIETSRVEDLSLTEDPEHPGEFIGSIPFRPLKAGLFYLILENELNGAIAYNNCARSTGKIRVDSN